MMKKPSILLILLVLITFMNCSNNDDDSDTADTADIKIDPLNELGLLEFKIFSNPTTAIDRVIEGSDDTFNYYGYGESVYVQSGQINIPQTLKTIVQSNPYTGVTNTIELDNNFIPIRFQRNSSNAQIDTIFTVKYDASKTEISVNAVNIEGNSTFIELITLNGIEFSNDFNGQSGKFPGGCDDPFGQETKPLNLCKSGNIYEQFGNMMEDYTGLFGIIKNVGKVVNWTVKTAKAKFCKNDPLGRNQIKPFTCEEYVKPTKSYVKLLDTGGILPFNDQVFLRTLSNCEELYGASQRVYHINMSFDENCTIVPPTNAKEFMQITRNFSGNITSADVKTFWYWNIDGKPTIEGNAPWDFSLIRENELGITILGNQSLYYYDSNDFGESITDPVIRPVEIVLRF